MLWLQLLLSSLVLCTGLNCSAYFYEHLPHGGNFRNALDFGARGDGVTDSTAALQAAFDYQQRGCEGCNVTASSFLVYLPAGTYLVSDTLVMWGASQLVGNALCPPTLLLQASAPGFSGASGLKPMLTANLGFNVSTARHAWWEQGAAHGGRANDLFYVQVHHLRLRTGAGNAGAVGILWPVAQQTSLRDIGIDMTASGAIGLDFGGSTDYNASFPYNATVGGGGVVEDVAVTGAATGLRLAGSQWTYRNITVTAAASACISATAMAWAHTVIAASLSACPTALRASIQGQGSLLLLDSTLGPGLGALAAIDVAGTQGGLYLQNVRLLGAVLPRYAVGGLLPTPPGGAIASWGLGPAYISGLRLPQAAAHLPLPLQAAAVAAGLRLACSAGSAASAASAPTLCGGSAEEAATGLAAAAPRPTFQGLPFVSATAYGAVGDGLADDTLALQRALAASPAVFLPSGTYRVSDTLRLQCNGTLLGEGLAELALAPDSPGFGSSTAPLKAVLATAPSTPAASCYAQLADVLLTTLGGGNGGAVLLSHTGSAASGLWDVGVRLYGYSVGLKAQLGPLQPGDAAYSVDSGGGVLSNAWWWEADHNLTDMLPMSNSTPGCASHCSDSQVLGVRVTTQGPLLLLGSNWEHSLQQEYNLTGASNVLAAAVQTEGTTGSVLLSGTGSSGPVAVFGTVFGSSTGRGDNKTLQATRGRGACGAAATPGGGGPGALDLSYRLLGSMQRLQTLLMVDDDYVIAGNLSTRWQCLAIFKECTAAEGGG